jgi:hypothetical protein
MSKEFKDARAGVKSQYSASVKAEAKSLKPATP